ncbi:MAG: YraN family protein [Deltaproteobacteria bacterium]|nr:YraN family protein [Deltaproteobacteria bacterium]
MWSGIQKARRRFRSKRRKILLYASKLRHKLIHYFAYGARGERAARRYLERRGYYIRHQNWVCDIGELDLVAQLGNQLVFIEVKSRAALVAASFSAVEAVETEKQARLKRLADWYVQDNLPHIKYRRLRRKRFDIVTVLFTSRWGAGKIRHYVNAF